MISKRNSKFNVKAVIKEIILEMKDAQAIIRERTIENMIHQNKRWLSRKYNHDSS